MEYSSKIDRFDVGFELNNGNHCLLVCMVPSLVWWPYIKHLSLHKITPPKKTLSNMLLCKLLALLGTVDNYIRIQKMNFPGMIGKLNNNK